jgi:serine/threonine protein kinase
MEPRLAGRYRVDGLLGRGGMGEVFYGYDERLDRRVAIKVLRSPGTGPGGIPGGVVPGSPEEAEILDSQQRDRTRFVREIRVTAGLELAGIPAVYDTGEEIAPDGTSRIWVVMQLLRGQTLEALLFQEDFPPAGPDSPWCSLSWAAAIVAQVAAVLADVHRVDIVHRDIKPANVMITDGGIVKVLDFGIAILRGASALPRLTQFDRTVGTPAYMSPEQNLGKPVTAASDIYSLGCLLFEALTGDKPFISTTSMPLRAHHVQTPPPSARSARANVPVPIDALILAMMAKEPAERPAAEDVYEALLPFIATGPMPAATPEEDRDPTRPFRRPLLSPPRLSVSAETPGSLEPLTDAEAELLLANVASLLDAEHPSRAVSLLEGAVQRSSDPARNLQLRETLAAALLLAGEYTRAAALFDAVGRDYARHLPKDDPIVLNCSYQAGQAYAEIGQPEAALSHLRFYVANASRTTAALKDPEVALQILESRFQIATLLAATGETGDALAELHEIRPLFAAVFGASSTMVRNIDKQIARLTPVT